MFSPDFYRDECRGVVLGVQDSQYVIFTTKCAIDFTWPNHDIRWQNFDYEDGEPEFRNECFILEGASANGGDEWFCYPGTEFTRRRRAETWRDILPQALDAGDIVTIDAFAGEKGELSDVALLFVPIHRGSTVQLQHLGLQRPKDAVRELLAKQSTLFGIEFEFNCPKCQRWVREYIPREKEAFLLGMGLGVVGGQVIGPLISRLFQVDQVVAAGTPFSEAQWDSTARFASSALRGEVLERDGFQCYYARLGMCDPGTCWACLAKDLHIDHVLPFSKGGGTTADNLVTSCAACNLSKGAELIGVWMSSSR